MTQSSILFKPRWKEELQAISSDGNLIFEMTAGQFHVYFPSESAWRKSVPDWAIEKWELYLAACKEWCENNRIALSVVDDGHVYAESQSAD